MTGGFADVRFALRSLKRRPLLTGLAAASLALAIGGNGAQFSFMSALLLRPMPDREPEPVVVVWQTDPANPSVDLIPVTAMSHADRRRELQSFSVPAAQRIPPMGSTGGDLRGPDAPRPAPYDPGGMPTVEDESRNPFAPHFDALSLAVATAGANAARVPDEAPRYWHEGTRHPAQSAIFIGLGKTPEERVARRAWVETRNQDPVTAWTNLTREEALLAPISGNKQVDDRLKQYALSKHGPGAEGLKSIIPSAVNAILLGSGNQRAAAVLSALTDAHAKGIATDVGPATKSWKDFSEFVRYSFGRTLPSMALSIAGGAAAGAVAGSVAPGIGTAGGAIAGGIGAALSTAPLSIQKMEEDAASRLGHRSPDRGWIYGGGLGAAVLASIWLGAPAGWAAARALRPATGPVGGVSG